MGRKTTFVAFACAAAFISPACAAAPDTSAASAPDPTPVVSQPAPSSPAPTPSVSSPAPTPRAPAAEGGDCPDLEFAEPGDPEQVAGWKQQIPVDGGPREYANGAVTLDDEGMPVAYTVAPGDIGAFIAARLCVNLAYLNNINGVRRSQTNNLHPGDTLNLDAHTILSVGDERGVVLQNPAPSPIPPQR